MEKTEGGRAVGVVALVCSLLSGCGTVKYTVDDGRKVDETLLANIRTYGAGQRALVPAIVRSAALKDPNCDTQWELPLGVATAYEWKADDRVAWVRGLGVDERLTVIAAAAPLTIDPGDKILEIDGYRTDDTAKMFTRLMDRRDSGKPSKLKLLRAGNVTVQPVQVCRGHVRLAPPNSPEAQDYHWEMSVHPLQVPETRLTADEALWVTLWTQGISEEGGARMKTFHYGKKLVTTLVDLASLVGGVTAVVNAATAAAAGAAAAAATTAAASQVATSVASTAAKNAVLSQIEKLAVTDATAAARAQALSAFESSLKDIAQRHALTALEEAAANRASLSGVAWVAGTVFDRADRWAYTRLVQLGGDPLAPLTLHYKLSQSEAAHNAFALDSERLPLVVALAKRERPESAVASVLNGALPAMLDLNLDDLAQASDNVTALQPSEAVFRPPEETFRSGGFLDALADSAPVQRSEH